MSMPTGSREALGDGLELLTVVGRALRERGTLAWKWAVVACRREPWGELHPLAATAGWASGFTATREQARDEARKAAIKLGRWARKWKHA